MITRIIDGFRELWRGEQPLSHAFWIYFVMWWIGLFFLSFFVAVGFAVLGLRPLGILANALAVVAYPFFAGIGVWRSANAYRSDGAFPTVAPALAKLVVLVVLVPMAWTFLDGGFEHYIIAFMR